MSEIPAGLPAGTKVASSGGYNRYIGPLYRLPDSGEGEDLIRRFAFIAEDRHMNSAGSVHGGMLMSLMDVAMSQTSRAASGAPRCATVSLTSDFVGPGKLGDTIEARIRITRLTRTMVFMAGEIVAADRKLLIANGLWKVPAQEKAAG